jgi:hypothetical protein
VPRFPSTARLLVQLRVYDLPGSLAEATNETGFVSPPTPTEKLLKLVGDVM